MTGREERGRRSQRKKKKRERENDPRERDLKLARKLILNATSTEGSGTAPSTKGVITAEEVTMEGGRVGEKAWNARGRKEGKEDTITVTRKNYNSGKKKPIREDFAYSPRERVNARKGGEEGKRERLSPRKEHQYAQALWTSEKSKFTFPA